MHNLVLISMRIAFAYNESLLVVNVGVSMKLIKLLLLIIIL